MQTPPPEDLAAWLQEAGKRRRPAPPEAAEPLEVLPPSHSGRPVQPKRLVICAVVAIAYLQYFYADVFLQILSSPSIIFFILVHGQLPPI